MRLIITRHGRTVENKAGLFQGRNPGKLSEEGIFQAKLLGKRLSDKNIDVIYCSPSGRCKETLENIVKELKFAPNINYDQSLQERDWGRLSGKKIEPSLLPLLENDTEESKKIGIEPVDELFERVKNFIDSVKKNDKNRTVLLITHRNTIMAMLMYFFDKTFKEMLNNKGKIQNAAYTEFEFDDKSGKIKQICFNDISHLTNCPELNNFQ